MSGEVLYEETGIAFNKYNTLCQLVMLQKAGSAALNAAESALFMPDLFTYFLTGKKVCEHSIASTSELLKAGKAEYSDALFGKFGLKKLFPRVVPSGTVAGELKEEIVKELRLKNSIPVIATLGHDTASAFFAAPVEGENAAILSSGTWSLLGAVLDKPIVTEKAAAAGYTNEIGFGGKVRFLRNIVGLWIIQECKRSWEKDGIRLSFAEIAEGAEKCEAGRCYIDPDAEEFYSPHDMPQKVADYCRRTGQYVPQTVFETARCVYDSLAQSYKKHLAVLKELTGKKIDVLHIVGGERTTKCSTAPRQRRQASALRQARRRVRLSGTFSASSLPSVQSKTKPKRGKSCAIPAMCVSIDGRFGMRTERRSGRGFPVRCA